MSTDTWRDQVIEALRVCPGLSREHGEKSADRVLPILDAAVAEMAEQIARKLDAVPDEMYPADVFGAPLSTDESRQINELLRDEGLGSLDRISGTVMRHAYRRAAAIAREQAPSTGLPTYFDVARSMTSDPEVHDAIDRAEREKRSLP